MTLKTQYAYGAQLPGVNRVVFVVNATGKKLCRDFESPYLAHLFVNKLKHSRKCRLVSYPNYH